MEGQFGGWMDDQYRAWMEDAFNKMFDAFEDTFHDANGPRLVFDQANFTIKLESDHLLPRKTEKNDDMDSDSDIESMDCTTFALQVYPLNNDPKLIPTIETKGSIGADLAASVDMKLGPWQYAEVPFGIQIQLGIGMYGRLALRGGYAKRFGLFLSGGVIDPDYRGEVKAILFNFSDFEFEIKKYDRIVQLIVEKAYMPSIWEMDKPPKIGDSERNFGCMRGGMVREWLEASALN